MIFKRIKCIHMRLRTRSIILLLFFICSSSLASPHVFAASVQRNRSVPNSYIVTPAPSSDVLINPGEGWVLYGNPGTQTAKTLAYASVGYVRYNWSDIEPQEGIYNWSVIDNDLNAWRAVGKKFAFGVMNANSSTPTNSYVTPQWVFQDGAASIKSPTSDPILGRKGIQYIPVWDNPIFLRKVQAFVTALALRYDGNPDIAYIDIRSYGNWGVQNVNDLPGSSLLSVQGVETHIQIYRNAFRRTQLIVPFGTAAYNSAYSWAARQHLGLRRDGIMVDSNGSELASAYGNAPIVFEFYGSYQWLSQKGYWQASKLLSAINIGKPSYISMGGWGNDAQVMLAQQPQLVARVANMMGYRFVINNMTLPDTITNQQTTMINASWKNQGVTYLYQSIHVALALLDSSNTVVQKQWLSNVDPRTWTPGKPITTRTAVTFTGVHAGSYKLAVGFFVNTTDSTPSYQIGNQGRTSSGWYVISTHQSVA